MYNWIQSFGSVPGIRPEDQARHWMKKELDLEYKGLGFYTTDTDSMLLTIQSREGERASGSVPQREQSDGNDYRLVLYVMNEHFSRTVWNTTPRTASDMRT